MEVQCPAAQVQNQGRLLLRLGFGGQVLRQGRKGVGVGVVSEFEEGGGIAGGDRGEDDRALISARSTVAGELHFGVRDPFPITEGFVGSTVESARSFNLQLKSRESGSKDLL